MNKWISAIAILTALTGCTSPEERALRNYLNQIEHATTEQAVVQSIVDELNEWVAKSTEDESPPVEIVSSRLLPASQRALKATEAVSNPAPPEVQKIHEALLAAERRRHNGVIAFASLTRPGDKRSGFRSNLSFLHERWVDALPHQELHRTRLLAACEEHGVTPPQWTQSPAIAP